MSDGPHRSLPMRKPWKELAKRGDQSTYDSEQVAEAATRALVSDFRNEVSWSLINDLKSIFGGLDNSLRIPEIAVQQLQDLKGAAAGSVFARNAIEWSIQLVNEGRLEPDAVYVAIGLAAKARGFANTRQIHEHVLRQTNQNRADGVTARLKSVIGGLSESSLGSILMNRQDAGQGRLSKSSSLDAGVPL
ncbi:MAG: hypothetical protein V4754_10270 [Pseudomonadota bacterium]